MKSKITKAFESQYEQVFRYLKLNALNNEEKEVAKNMIKNWVYLFHLPGDKLTYTKIIDHNIGTINSIIVKQYRFPLIYKEEIRKGRREYLNLNAT